MRLFPILAAALAVATTAQADVAAVVDDHILPGLAQFAQSAEALDAAAQASCDGPETKAAYQEAFDAWLAVSHIRFGPVEKDGLSLKIVFWPDPKNQTGRALGRLIADEDPIVDDPVAFGNVSVAAQGLFALEQMLFDPPTDGAYGCALTQAIAARLAVSATALRDAWRNGYGETLRSAGAEGNTTYPSKRDAQRTLYTALSTGLTFVHDQRLGRPLGSFDRPRPERAEARRSGRSLRNVRLSLLALRDLTAKFAPDAASRTLEQFDAAIADAESLDDPVFAGAADPARRIRIEALQQDVAEIQERAAEEIGLALGISAGFNSADGD